MPDFIVHARFVCRTGDGWTAADVQDLVHERLTTDCEPIADNILGIDVIPAPTMPPHDWVQ